MDYTNLIEDSLKSCIKKTYPEIIYEAMEYSLLAGGKRMRPKLMLYTAEGFGGDIGKVMPFACAMEMIHTYSLIHDDLPCMDNDDYRRGRPTNHKQYGEAIALLAGDGLLNTAYEIMASSAVSNFNTGCVKAMYEIAEASGVNGMIGGQTADVISEDKSVGFDTLLYIQENKTAAIIKASMACGAILSGASQNDAETIRKAGRLLGIAFQIKDDILDITSTSEIMGKTVGSDAKNKKATHVALYGMEKAEKDYLDYCAKAIGIIDGMNLRTNSLKVYMEDLTKRNF